MDYSRVGLTTRIIQVSSFSLLYANLTQTTITKSNGVPAKKICKFNQNRAYEKNEQYNMISCYTI